MISKMLLDNHKIELPLNEQAYDDEKLVKRAWQGDFRAFESLFYRYNRPLWKYAYRVLGNEEDASDVVQQVLIQLHRSLTNLQQPTRFRAWLFTIAHHKCIDLLRSSSSISINFSDFSAASQANQDFSPLQVFPDPSPLPDEIIENKEMRHILQQAILNLPERAAQVVALRYSTDLTFAEIGEVLDIKENSVKTLFQRAKNQLRQDLKHTFSYEQE